MSIPPPLPYPSKLTFYEVADLTRKIIAALGVGAFAAAKFPFEAKEGTKSFRAHVSHAFLRKLTKALSVRQIQLSTTDASYKKFAKSRGIAPCTSTWGETGRGHWVGSISASDVLVWFHGGNYYSPAHPAYFDFLNGIVHAVCRTGKQLCVFFPEYTLAPHAKYPCQLREGLDFLRYLVEGQNKAPSNIILAGDSAGGNMVLAILSHLSHPHPDSDIPGGPSLQEPLAGALMLSPWVTFDQTWGSIERNKSRDCVSLVPSRVSVEYWLGERPLDNYNEPLRAPVNWWDGVKARQMLLVTGGDDLMLDSHQAFAANLKRSNPHNTQVVVAPGEGHIAPILNLILGDHSGFESTRAIEKWTLSVID
ncbi:Alpha/Beta hydrolase protein [Aspergillus undulatus]|uniref:Alpha/Beta hydrolase protein n=1 Tax=Aspergillus undulatus TaxID=1810928 RepID=UPI003CCD97E7